MKLSGLEKDAITLMILVCLSEGSLSADELATLIDLKVLGLVTVPLGKISLRLKLLCRTGDISKSLMEETEVYQIKSPGRRRLLLLRDSFEDFGLGMAVLMRTHKEAEKLRNHPK